MNWPCLFTSLEFYIEKRGARYNPKPICQLHLKRLTKNIFKAYLVTILKALAFAWTFHFSTRHNLPGSAARSCVIKIKNFPGVSASLRVFAKINSLPLKTVQLWCAISKRDRLHLLYAVLSNKQQ